MGLVSYDVLQKMNMPLKLIITILCIFPVYGQDINMFIAKADEFVKLQKSAEGKWSVKIYKAPLFYRKAQDAVKRGDLEKGDLPNLEKTYLDRTIGQLKEVQAFYIISMPIDPKTSLKQRVYVIDGKAIWEEGDVIKREAVELFEARIAKHFK